MAAEVVYFFGESVEFALVEGVVGGGGWEVWEFGAEGLDEEPLAVDVVVRAVWFSI